MTLAILKRASALTARITRRRLHNIPKEKIEGDYQVWIGYLRKPPPAVTGFDIPGWAPYRIFLKNQQKIEKKLKRSHPFANFLHAGWAGIAIFMWIWASGPVLKNRELRREVVGRYIYPQLEISQCKTEQERREFVQAFIDEHYKDDEEEDDDE